MVYIVQATFEDGEQAEFEKEDLLRQKSFLSDFVETVENNLVVRASNEQKAGEVKNILKDVTTSDRIKIFEREEGGKLQTLKEAGEGLKKGFRQTQKVAGEASERVGKVSEAPEGGMLNQMFGERKQEGEFIQVLLEFPSTPKTTGFIEHMVEDKQWNQRGFSLNENGVEVTISNEKGVDILKEEAKKFDVDNIKIRS